MNERTTGQPEPTAADTADDSAEDYAVRVSPFVERFAADLTQIGFQRMAARVFACLFASERGALSSTELVRRLQVSPAAVSGAVRYLAQLGLVSREREPGSRRERYRVTEDWYKVMLHRDQQLDRLANVLLTGADMLGHDTQAGRRAARTHGFFEFFKEELASILERWRKQHLEPDEPFVPKDREDPGPGANGPDPG